MDKEVRVDAHIIQCINAREQYIAFKQFVHDAATWEKTEDVGHCGRNDIGSAIVPLVSPFLSQVVYEDGVFSVGCRLRFDQLVEEEVCIAQVKQEERLVCNEWVLS